MYYTVKKHSGHLKTPEKCRKHSLAACVFYVSLVFSNTRRVLSQCNTRLRAFLLLNNADLCHNFTFRNSGSRSAMSSMMARYILNISRHRGRSLFCERKLLDVRFLCIEITSRNADLFHSPFFSSKIYETGKQYKSRH